MEGTFNNCESDEIGLNLPVKKSQNERLNDVAWWERKLKKQVIQEALEFYLNTKKEIPHKNKS